MSQTADYYVRLFGGDPELATTRQNYAMKEVTLPSAERRERMTEFFFWTAWAASTERSPGAATYTNDWPHEPLIDNRPTPEDLAGPIRSALLLLLALGRLVGERASVRGHDGDDAAG